MVRAAHDAGKSVSLHPLVLFPFGSEKWWQSQPTDEETFWVQFVTEYRSFVLQYAELAASTGADELIIGGEWLLPALPVNGHFEIYSQPGNIERFWEQTFIDVRERFHGQVSFVVDLDMAKDPPEFLFQADRLYLEWDLPMESLTVDSMNTAFEEYTETLQAEIEKPVVVMLAIPSVQGYALDCVPSPSGEGDCLDTSELKLGPTLENPAVSDLEMQSDYYQAFLSAVSLQDWIAGVVSQGYYSDLALHDASASIHGKPAEVFFESWIELIAGN